MQIDISIKIEAKSRQINVRLDQNRVIIEFLEQLNGLMGLGLNLKDKDYVKSNNEDRNMGVYGTFKDYNIQSGDVISI